VKRTPGVVNASLSDRNPGDGGTGRSQGFTRQGMQGEPTTIAWEPIGEAYFETYGVQMLAGRKFNLANRLDDRAGLEDEALASRGLNIIINETATKNLEFARPADAVNAVISGGGLQLRVVGVAKDVRFGSPKEKVPPLIYVRDTIMPEGRSFSTLAVRYRGDPRTVLAGLEASWRRVASDYPFEAETVETSLDTFYRPDEQRSRLVTLGAGVAALIGCLGLYGLAAFSSERRTKEIGVRKVLGASSADVFRLLVGQFLRPVVIANLIAWPLAFVLMREWLGGFDQRVELTPVYFITATALALLVALLTVAGQALRVARCDPGTALRYE
jgi:putative ABC transport system permease protein